MKRLFAKLQEQARYLKKQAIIVYCIAHHPDTPWPVKILALLVAAYAFSPIDLIPDAIPVLGYLDDLIIVPLGVALIVYLTPAPVIEQSRLQASLIAEKPASYTAAAVIILIWLLCAAWLAQMVLAG